MESYFDTNKELWNGKVPYHLESDLYALDAFKTGATSLKEIELALIDDVKGKSILHPQCHFGQDSLSLARMGADVVGVDFSSEAIKTAKQLNQELNLNTQFIESNVYDIPQHINQEFDVVFASYGVVLWLPDLTKWAKIIYDRLKKGGRFILVEFHPTIYVLDWDSRQIHYNYFHETTPYLEITNGTYADPDAPLQSKEYFWVHNFSDMMMPFLKLGMKLIDFQEYDFSPYNVFGEMSERKKDQFVFKDMETSFPYVFSMVLEK